MLKVYTQENKFSNRKKPYVFKSRNERSIDEDEIIHQIAESHTTITEADARAVMTVLEDIFWRNINEGNAVKLFMGSFRAGASGSAETSDEVFKPRKVHYKGAPERDHAISLLFESDLMKEKILCTSVKLKRVSTAGFCNPRIFSIDGAVGTNGTAFARKDYATISGSFIKIDPNEEGQGVFLRSGSGIFRVRAYIRNTRSTVCFQIPEELGAGDYSVFIKTKRTTVLHTSNELQITVKN